MVYGGAKDTRRKSIRTMWTRIAFILAAVIALSLSACSNSKDSAKTKSLYAQGLDIVQLMSEIAQTEECVDILTASNGLKNIAQSIGAGDYSAPKVVYAISIADESLAALAELSNLNHVSNDVKAFLRKRALGALMTQINSKSGVESLAVSSVLAAGKTFVNENATEDVIYLYTYENALPVAVTFTTGEDQTVSASGAFIMYDGFPCGSADEIRSFFSHITVDVSEVPPS